MKKLLYLVAILSFLCLLSPKNILAQANKFGIHVLEPTDLAKAAQLVNSSGGDWGWVTVVIRDDDMNHDKWQGFMDTSREKHLIPLVRIATHLEGENWVKPQIQDSQKWADFLGNLNWPIADRYVIIFNEPNHAKEWGNEINPREYAQILNEYTSKFKIYNLKFKILNAGLDLAAPNGKETMESYRFMQKMNWEVPGIFEKLDGWVSHSYPNHGFLGKPWETGKTSIQGYLWELNTLKNYFGVKKEPPVFITETGWPKDSSKFIVQSTKYKVKTKNLYYSEKTVAEYFKYAYENVWLKDNQIKAVTPFVLNYPSDLFYEFSWLDTSGEPFPQYKAVQSVTKTSQWPIQETKFEILDITLPPFLPAETKFSGRLTLINRGQSILGERGESSLKAMTVDKFLVSDLIFPPNFRLKPNQSIELDFSLFSSTSSGEFTFGWENLPKHKIKVFPKSIFAKAEFGFWKLLYLNLRKIF